MANLIEIEGIGPVYAEKLKAAGLTTTDALLEAGATPKGRQELEEKTGISHAQILRWVNMADLFRIKGIGEQYSDLLEAAGVDTVPELAQRNPVNLLVQLTQCNEDRQRVRKLPTEDQVAKWVEQAKGLPRAVKY
jgi:predicted flap endonuclease-1-like 5' DNA nuclease